MKQQTRLFMTLKPDCGNETTYTYNSGSVSAVITLNKDLRASDSYSAYLYNDELMLLDYATTGEKTIERGGRSLKMELEKTTIWIPGNYFLLLRNGCDKVLRFDITLGSNAQFTVAPPRLCPFLTQEDILSSKLCEQRLLWTTLSVRPGVKQFRLKAIERAKLTLLNNFRSQLVNSRDMTKSYNYVISSRGYTMTNQAITYFSAVIGMNYERNYIDCSTLYDPMASNNPYEQLNEKFSQSTSSDNAFQIEMPVRKDQIYVLYNIGALLENGGKIIKKIRQHTSNLIIAGTQSETDSLFEQNPSLRDLFPKENYISIEPFSLTEIIFWFFSRTSVHGLVFSPEAKDWMCRKLAHAYDEGLLAHWTENDIDNFVVKNVQPNYCRRLADTILTGRIDVREVLVLTEDIDSRPLTEKGATYEDALVELNDMIGLDDIKHSLTTIANNMNLFVRRADLGLHNSGNTAHHAIFMGNPGTGKTTVAGLLGKIYHSLGLLSRGDVIRVDRTHIIGRFLGDTEDNMKQILDEARGNVLFVDEAYTLYSNEGCNDFGRRAVECLLNVLTQKNPDILIIFAGYQEEMDKLMSMNPGLVSRFPYKFIFKDYTADELMQIALSLLRKDDYVLSADAAALLRKAIADILSEKIKNFGNARWITQLVHNGIIPAMANRLASTPHALTREAYQLIEASDVKRAYEQFNSKTIELKPRRQVGFSA